MKENFCSTCGQELGRKDLSVRCRLCMRNYHGRCWEKTGGCTTWGCAGKPVLENGEEPVAYKRCPYCGEEIVDFAVKCRYCRTSLLTGEEFPGPAKKGPGRIEDPLYRKDPILTGLLNLIFPGAGYMYLGMFTKGLVWFIIAVAAWFFTRGLGLIAVYLWVMYDSSRQAVAHNRGDPPKGPRQAGWS